MSDLNRMSDAAQAILDGGRDLDNPSDIDRARATRAVLARVAAAGAAVAVGTSSTAAAMPILKVLMPLALVAAGTIGGGLWWRAQQAPAAPAAMSATATAPAPAPAPAVAPPEVEAAPPAPRATPRPRSRPAARALPAGDSLQQETALLAQANTALRDGDPARSLQLLAEVQQRFPNGTLREETDATRLIARCQLNPGPRTREAARRFLQQHPATPLGSRLAASCLATMSR